MKRIGVLSWMGTLEWIGQLRRVDKSWLRMPSSSPTVSSSQHVAERQWVAPVPGNKGSTSRGWGKFTWSPLQIYFGITVVLSFLGWTGLARVVRGKILSLREEDYATAALLAGADRTLRPFIL